MWYMFTWNLVLDYLYNTSLYYKLNFKIFNMLNYIIVFRDMYTYEQKRDKGGDFSQKKYF